jgi:ribosomal-protein-serine acetyltransferase
MMGSFKVDEKVVLQRINHNDTSAVYRLIDKYRLLLRQWLPFVDATTSEEQTESFIRSLFNPASRELIFTIRYDGEVTGLVGYKDIDRTNKKLEIGYWIAPVFEGRGMVTASVKVLVDEAFKKMQMNRVQVKCAIGNRRSSNIPKRLGFTLEGVERAGEFLNGRFVDLETYSMLKQDWQALKKQ